MTSIPRVLEEYNGIISMKEVKEQLKSSFSPVEVEKTDTFSNPTTWPEDFMPYTEYLENKSERNLERIETWKNTEFNFKSKKMVQILTQIDLDMVKALTAEDLVTYDGHTASKAVMHIQNEGKALVGFLSSNFDARALFKLLKYAVMYKNYNLIHILVKTLQSKELSTKKMEKIQYYKNILDNEEGGIFPLSWILKDCEDSNLNVESEVASIRFCRLVERLKEMKKIEFDFNVSEKQKQIIYSKLWDVARTSAIELKSHKSSQTNLYLLF
ncbi:hypothetical protein GINT2_002054 [Glugoides intestinalis]